MNFSFENSLFFMPLLVGSIFILAGFISYKFPPKKINDLYGYRTANSMKSQERWDFSQRYAAILMLCCGLFLLVVSIFGLFFDVSEGKGVAIAMFFLISSVIVLIYKTETAIKQNFNDQE